MVNKNLKFLRTHNGLTQKQFAERLGVKQSAIGAYEEERATPPLACLTDVADQFKVSLDVLIRKDLSKISESEWKAQKRNREILAISVDRNDRENVELVMQKASAGYLNGYQDPEFVSELPKMNVPVLPRNATYRAFEIKGDSMLPVPSGAIIFGEYIEDVAAIKNGKPYVIVTKEEGIVFKRVFNFVKEEGKLLLVSDNRLYPPYVVEAADVLEVWNAKGFFSTHFAEVNEPRETPTLDHLALTILQLQQDLQRLKKK
jgi:transcriptional regulator with XRE-family HTH domain